MLRIKIPTQLVYLPDVNVFINKALPDEFKCISPQVELAVEELLVNVFSYAYKDNMEKLSEAEVTCRMVDFDDTPCFCLAVLDWGQPFNPFSEAPVPDTELDADERPIGGLGIFLIKSMVAHYSYSYSNKSNFIELYFTLPTDSK